jgi:hypothetical protein
MLVQHRPSVTAKPRRRRAAALAHSAHQLDRRGRADLKPQRGLTDRTALLDRPNDPLAQV